MLSHTMGITTLVSFIPYATKLAYLYEVILPGPNLSGKRCLHYILLYLLFGIYGENALGHVRSCSIVTLSESKGKKYVTFMKKITV